MTWDELSGGCIGVIHWAVRMGYEDVAYRYSVFVVGDLFRLYFGVRRREKRIRTNILHIHIGELNYAAGFSNLQTSHQILVERMRYCFGDGVELPIRA